MILPPVARVFFAIDLPQAAKSQVTHYIDSLQKMSKTNVVRWTKPENLHITLQFLADVNSDDISTMIENVRTELLNASNHITISLKGLHLFPDPHRPRVLVLDVAPQEGLANLSALVGRGIQQSNYDIERRAFRAHLTIGRIKSAKMSALSFLVDAMAPEVDDITIKDVVLFQSEPHPQGSKYVVLDRILINDVKCA